MLTAYPAQVRAGASSLIVYQGEPYRSVSWSLTGSGTLTPLASMTNAQGAAHARYTPGTVGDVVSIEVTAGA